jgi:hypothetical protein
VVATPDQSGYLQRLRRDHFALHDLARRAWERVQSTMVVLAVAGDFQAKFADPGSDASRAPRAHLGEFIANRRMASREHTNPTMLAFSDRGVFGDAVIRRRQCKC